jgi:flagellar motility protein MotE (MotC chaperone)
MRFLLASPRHLLPLMIFMGVLVLGLRVNDVWNAALEGRMFSPTALAETKSDGPPAITPPALAPNADKAAADAAPAPAAAPSAPAPAAADTSKAASDAPPVDEDVSPAEMEVLKQLSARRQELDKRNKELDTREALIKVAEQRVDQKIKEMSTLRLQLQSMINQVSETQAAQLENLVKVYETMKPEDAATIFDKLDMPILLNVIQRMKPKNTAPIMAKMTPEKAKEVTVALTKQDQLPQIK